MAERKQYDPVLVAVGNMLAEKRKALGLPYKNRENFIERRKEELFAGGTGFLPDIWQMWNWAKTGSVSKS